MECKEKMNDILCDECKKRIGLIDEDTYVECDDMYYGVVILCKECKNKKPLCHWEYRSPNNNVLLDNQSD